MKLLFTEEGQAVKEVRLGVGAGPGYSYQELRCGQAKMEMPIRHPNGGGKNTVGHMNLWFRGAV